MVNFEFFKASTWKSFSMKRYKSTYNNLVSAETILQATYVGRSAPFVAIGYIFRSKIVLDCVLVFIAANSKVVIWFVLVIFIIVFLVVKLSLSISTSGSWSISPQSIAAKRKLNPNNIISDEIYWRF